MERNFDASRDVFNEIDCLESILTYSKLNDPNWHELANFVNFLNNQLVLSENATLLKEVKSMKSICVQLLTIMANDFGLPSLNINNDNGNDALNLDAMTITESRRWENMIHPYILFNQDRQTVTFLGKLLDKRLRCLIIFFNCFHLLRNIPGQENSQIPKPEHFRNH